MCTCMMILSYINNLMCENRTNTLGIDADGMLQLMKQVVKRVDEWLGEEQHPPTPTPHCK